MIQDAELLHRYAHEGSQDAFTELVRRNVDFVYSVALRHVSDAHRAEDIVQSVFIDLARKARSLERHPALVSWLYTSTRYAGLKSLRSEQRRHTREQEAHTMQNILSSDPAPDWERIRPILDEAMDALGERDREILLLRYFRGLNFAELATLLRANEGTVRMRADRALDRMNGLLQQRGIKSTVSALGVVMGGQFAAAAPAGLTASVSGAVFSTALGGGVAETLFLMSKFKIAVVGLFLAGGASLAVFEHHRDQAMQSTFATIARDQAALERKVSDLNRLMAEARDREVAALRFGTPPRTEPAPAPAPPPVEEPPPVPGVSRVAPAGWAKNGSKPGSYVVGVDQNEMWAGLPSAYVQSIDSSTDGFGGMMQTNSAEDFIGKRVRLSGWVKTERADDGGGHLWLRIDGQQRGVSLQFDNMDRNPVKGTTPWQQYSVVLDVPPEATAMAYGFFVQGRGKMWVSGTKMEPVGSEVASTNRLTNQAPRLPKTPVNLGFDPNQPKS